MKKNLWIFIFGVLFLLCLGALYFERGSSERAPLFIHIDNPKNSEYSGFSSSFYKIRSELRRNDSNFLFVPGDCDAIRIILHSDFQKKHLSKAPAYIDNKPFRPNSGLVRKDQIENESSVVIDDLTGYEFGAFHQYLVASSVLAFVAFFTSILIKTKNQ